MGFRSLALWVGMCEGALFSYLMGDNIQRRREKWVLCEASRKLGGCKEMGFENGSF